MDFFASGWIGPDNPRSIIDQNSSDSRENLRDVHRFRLPIGLGGNGSGAGASARLRFASIAASRILLCLRLGTNLFAARCFLMFVSISGSSKSLDSDVSDLRRTLALRRSNPSSD